MPQPRFPQLRAVLLLALGVGGLALATQAPPPKPPAPATVPTYADQVQPLLERQCQGCHRSGGIAPFALETYEQARDMAPQIAAVTAARRMPPWMPGGQTPPLKYERRLTDAEIRTLGAWAAAGAPQGGRP